MTWVRMVQMTNHENLRGEGNGERLTKQFVCTAGMERRLVCGNKCECCRSLKADRREMRLGAINLISFERRFISNLLPAGYGLAGVDGSLAAGGGWSMPFPSALMILLLFFNLLDVLLTARALSLGVVEANPVMAGLLSVSIPFGLFAKFTAVSFGAWLLWRYRHLSIAARGMKLLTACYGAVVVYHVVFQIGTI